MGKEKAPGTGSCFSIDEWTSYRSMIMPLPANFSGYPREDLHHHARTVAAELKKTIRTSKDIAELRSALDRYLNVLRHLDWHRQTTDIYQKDEVEKLAQRLVREFERYIKSVEADSEETYAAAFQSVLEAINRIEQLVETNQAV